MPQSVVTFDKQVFQGTAVASGGTFSATFSTTIDQCHYLRATCIATLPSGGHLSGSAVLYAENCVENKNGTISAASAAANSNNPSNSNSGAGTGANPYFAASHAMANDFFASGSVTLTWGTSASSNIVTYTNVGNPSPVNVTIVIESMAVGSQ